jgi:hypothetical protein
VAAIVQCRRNLNIGARDIAFPAQLLIGWRFEIRTVQLSYSESTADI